MPRRLPLPTLLALTALGTALWAACSGPGIRAPADGYSDRSWLALLAPRPTPRAEAPRIAIDRVSGADGILESVGMAELVLLRFLNRTDIWVIDRRRLSLAAARTRRGLPRPPAAPALGQTPEIQFVVRATLGPPEAGMRPLNVRLVEAVTDRVRATWRDSVAEGASAVALARAVGTALERGLAEEGLLAGSGEEAKVTHAGEGWSGAAILSPEEAFRAFMEGVVAEDRYNWVAARAAYTRARTLGGPTFVEPLRALGRVARLRAGGTLGAS